MEKKSEFSYSIGLTEIAVLNADKSFPAPNDWEDKNALTGEVRKHRGGLVGKSGTFNIDGWKTSDFKIGVTYGKRYAEADFVSTAADKTKATVDEMVSDLNTVFATLATKGINLEAKKTALGDDYDAEYLKITTKNANDLPFFAKVGINGKLGQLLGITGWVATKEAKSFKDDFEKDNGQSVDQTSGFGLRCSIKEPDKIKGTNLTMSFASMPLSMYAMMTGNSFNKETGELYIDNAMNPPNLAVRYFVEQYEEGNQTKGNFIRVKCVLFPSVQLTPNGNEASENSYNNEELQGSGGDNSRSNLPLKFIKEVSLADYKEFVFEA